MALLQWNDRYSVGVAAVDHEHRELIDLINRLHDRLGSAGGRDAVSAFFGDLFRGISAHFALEETFMRQHGYDALAAHKADHERLLDDLRDLMEAYEEDGAIDDATLAVRLDAWFSRHFETHDARLHRAFGTHPH
jgi:hemerythrin-like metal-binding protein